MNIRKDGHNCHKGSTLQGILILEMQPTDGEGEEISGKGKEEALAVGGVGSSEVGIETSGVGAEKSTETGGNKTTTAGKERTRRDKMELKLLGSGDNSLDWALRKELEKGPAESGQIRGSPNRASGESIAVDDRFGGAKKLIWGIDQQNSNGIGCNKGACKWGGIKG